MPTDQHLSHNEIATLGPAELAELWEDGRISHLMTNVDIKRGKNGKLVHFTFVAKQYPPLTESDADE